MTKTTKTDTSRLDQVVADARRYRDEQERGYRARALELYPWICGRCSREFSRTNLHELTVHHKDHNHDNNPQDGSNWELLCLYCHDNEHQRLLEAASGHGGGSSKKGADVTYQPFAVLKDLLK